MKEGYEDFIVNEYLPAMAKIDYVTVTNCWNVVLGGFATSSSRSPSRTPRTSGTCSRTTTSRGSPAD